MIPPNPPAPPRFTSREYSQTHGISRQAALKRLNRMIGLGQLVRYGVGRKVVYEPTRQWMPPTEDITPRFWTRLVSAFPGLVYVLVAAELGAYPRTRKGAWQLLRDIRPNSFAVLDFHGIREVSAVFLEELVARGQERTANLRWINVPQHVRDQAAGRVA